MKHLLTRIVVICIFTAALAACGSVSASRQTCETFKFSNESGKYISFTLAYKPNRTTFIDLFSRPRSTTSYISDTNTFLLAYDVYGEVRALNVILKDPPAGMAKNSISLARKDIKACTYIASIGKDGGLVLAPHP